MLGETLLFLIPAVIVAVVMSFTLHPWLHSLFSPKEEPVKVLRIKGLNLREIDSSMHWLDQSIIMDQHSYEQLIDQTREQSTFLREMLSIFASTIPVFLAFVLFFQHRINHRLKEYDEKTRHIEDGAANIDKMIKEVDDTISRLHSERDKAIKALYDEIEGTNNRKSDDYPPITSAPKEDFDSPSKQPFSSESDIGL